jgi:DNA-directed RNA polymerase specialized sigma subunit
METLLKNNNNTSLKYNLKEPSFKEICEWLDRQHEEYLSWKWESYSSLEILERIKNRKGTFLTS